MKCTPPSDGYWWISSLACTDLGQVMARKLLWVQCRVECFGVSGFIGSTPEPQNRILRNKKHSTFCDLFSIS